MSKHQLPPFRSLLKSMDVEDPVNLMVHRPLAYGFVAAIFRTPITPNMVTFMALIAGIVAGAMFLWGTPGAMLAGGILLWSSAILDGADGILARAKKMHSEFGRALDGACDMFVAIFTVFPAFWHMWVKYEEPYHMWGMVPVIGLTAVHLWAYDYFKESYLRGTRPGRGGEGKDLEGVEQLVEPSKDKGLITYIAVKHILIPYTQTQNRVISFLDPAALGRRRVARDEEEAALYRKHNVWPMRLWALVSLAPHTYLMSICAMLDRLDVYFWIRLVVMNVIFVVALVWQRRATRVTQAELGTRAPSTTTAPA